MIFEKNGYDLHLFICTNEKKNGGGCGPGGAEAVVDHLKSWTKKQGFQNKIRVKRSGCLGKCESGIACVAYPDAEWALKVTPDDLPAIEEWIRSRNASASRIRD
jgi:(2Fe-2S) ferredoxin